MTRRAVSGFAFLVVGVLALIGAGDARAAIVADTANDICGPAIDPCNITQEVDVVSGSILDFGTRTVNVSGNGIIDAGSGTARLRAGRFTVQVSATGIRLNDGALGGLLTWNRTESVRSMRLFGASPT
jgi:hypothetical protein